MSSRVTARTMQLRETLYRSLQDLTLRDAADANLLAFNIRVLTSNITSIALCKLKASECVAANIFD